MASERQGDIGMGLGEVRVETQSFTKAHDRLGDPVLVDEDRAQVVVREPGVRILGKGVSPESFEVGVHMGLAPGQGSEDQQEASGESRGGASAGHGQS